jgi:hypothetical protein
VDVQVQHASQDMSIAIALVGAGCGLQVVAHAQGPFMSNHFVGCATHTPTLTYSWPQVLPGDSALLVADGDNYAIRKVCVYAVFQKLLWMCHGVLSHTFVDHRWT